jgi:ABC-2 type transport system ATP-binding protein
MDLVLESGTMIQVLLGSPRKTSLLSMDAVTFQSVSKFFAHRPALFNWFGRERVGRTRALEDVTFSVAAGQIIVFLGPNGSGKTTLLKLVSTMLLPDSGRVIVKSADTQIDAQSVRRHVGFAVSSERSFFPRLSACENLAFFAALEDVPRRSRREMLQRTLNSVGLAQHADTLVMKFSSGMFQRLGMARALIKQPSVLLLDEPTRSIDPECAQLCWQIVRTLAQNGTAVVVATHSFEEAVRLGDQVAVLFHGALIASRQLSICNGVEDLRSFYFQTTGATDNVQYAFSPEAL